MWLQKLKDTSREKQCDHSQMGEASGKGLGSPLGRWDPQHSREYACVGESNGEEAKKCHQGQKACDPKLTDILIRTGEFQELGNLTEELVDDVGTTEVDGESSRCMHNSRDDPTDPDGQDSVNTGVDIHDDFIAQGKADGHVAIVGHHCEHGQLSRCTENESQTLQYAFPEGNTASMPERVTNGPWYRHRDIAYI